MDKTLLIFSCSRTWEDSLLRFGSFSRWSALDIVVPQQPGQPVFVIGLDPKTGLVSKMPLANRVVMSSSVGLMTLSQVCPEPIVEKVISQLGKPFDWEWLKPERFRSKSWRQVDKWYPAELMAWAFEMCGIKLFNENRRKITLKQFWDLPDKPLMLVNREIVKSHKKTVSSEREIA